MPPLLLLSPGRLSHPRPARPQSGPVCLPRLPGLAGLLSVARGASSVLALSRGVQPLSAVHLRTHSDVTQADPVDRANVVSLLGAV